MYHVGWDWGNVGVGYGETGMKVEARQELAPFSTGRGDSRDRE